MLTQQLETGEKKQLHGTTCSLWTTSLPISAQELSLGLYQTTEAKGFCFTHWRSLYHYLQQGSNPPLCLMGTIMFLLKTIVLRLYSALRINGNLGAQWRWDCILVGMTRRQIRKWTVMTLEGKKKGTVLKELARETRSALETAPYHPSEVLSSVFPSQKSMRDIHSLNKVFGGTINIVQL